ncbi:unnamed protein product, partial [Gulo gulo]
PPEAAWDSTLAKLLRRTAFQHQVTLQTGGKTPPAPSAVGPTKAPFWTSVPAIFRSCENGTRLF